MAKRIEGYGANRFGEYQFDVAPDENDGWQRATLVICDERVFTHEEVVAMLREMEEDYHTEASRQQFINIANEHGVSIK